MQKAEKSSVFLLFYGKKYVERLAVAGVSQRFSCPSLCLWETHNILRIHMEENFALTGFILRLFKICTTFWHEF